MPADHIYAVKPFDLDKYLGKWYEIARLNYRHERNIEQVTAEYSFLPNGLVKVCNRGFDPLKFKWKQSIGKAKFAGDHQEGKLKVSFFWFFYAGYNVIALDPGYQNELVAGDSLKYLWILSRQKTIAEDVKNNFLDVARRAGYDTGKLHWTKQ